MGSETMEPLKCPNNTEGSGVTLTSLHFWDGSKVGRPVPGTVVPFGSRDPVEWSGGPERSRSDRLEVD